MSDNVHFLTTTGPTPSGCSGFPFPVFHGTPTHPDAFPVVLPLDDANSANSSCARLYYRERTWSLSTDLDITNGGTTTMPNGDLPDSIPPTSELDLRRNGGRQALFSISAARYRVDFRLFTQEQLWLDGVDFRPGLTIEGFIEAPGGDRLDFRTFDTALYTDGTITATIDGQNVTLFLKNSSPGITYTLTHFDIAATSFWPYDFGGNPIYDTATGLELQNPRL